MSEIPGIFWLSVVSTFFSAGVFWFCLRLFRSALKESPKGLRSDFASLVEENRASILRMRSEMIDLTDDLVGERERAAVERKRLSMERARQAKRDQKAEAGLGEEPQGDVYGQLRAKALAAGHRLI